MCKGYILSFGWFILRMHLDICPTRAKTYTSKGDRLCRVSFYLSSSFLFNFPAISSFKLT